MESEAAREIAGSRSNIGDGLRRFKVERHHHIVRLLPFIARRIFEHLGVLAG
jgi:hypothetical protein